jgi:hypothetical protein
MKPSNYPIVTSGLCGTASFASSSTWSWNIVRGSCQIVVTGACVGTFRLEASNDQGYGAGGRPVGDYIPSNWNVIGSASTLVCSTTAATSRFLIPLTELCYEHVRLFYSDGSAGAATGTFNARMMTFGL